MKFNKSFITFGILLLLPGISSASTVTDWIYVTQNAISQMSVINGNTNSIVTNIPLEYSEPGPIAITPNQDQAYISSSYSGEVIVVDITSNTIITTLDIPSAGNLAIAPNGNFVLVLSNGSNTLYIINTTTFAISTYNVGAAGRFIIIDSTSSYAFITTSNATVYRLQLNSSTGSVITSTNFMVGTGSNNAGLAIAPNTGDLYIANHGSPNSTLFQITTPLGTPTAGATVTLTALSGPSAVVIDSNGTNAYVVGSITSNIGIVSLAGPTFTKTVTVGSDPIYAALTSDNAFLYVPNNGGNVSVINTSTQLVSSTITLGSSPDGVAIATKSGGVLDTTFGTSSGYTLTPVSRADFLLSAAIQIDDKIIIAGRTLTTTPTAFLARYTSNGLLDTTFNSRGSTPGTQTLLVGTESIANAAILDNNGDILIAGLSIQSPPQPPTKILLARYLTSGPNAGTLDTFNFGSGNGYVTQFLGTGATGNSVAVQSATYSHRIIVGGSGIQDGSSVFLLAGFTSSGVVDPTFGTGDMTFNYLGAASSIASIAVIPSGPNQDYIMAVGTVDNKLTIARYTPAGILDKTNFGGGTGIIQPNLGGPSTGYHVMIDNNNNPVITGSVSLSGVLNSVVLRCSTTNGNLDTTFNGTGYVIQSIGSIGSEFFSSTLTTETYEYGEPNNFIVAGGYAIGLNTQISLARYTPAGLLDVYFGNNGIALTTLGGNSAIANALGTQSSGETIAAGTSNGTFYVARFLE